MSEYVDVEWMANWNCPKCRAYCDELDYDIDFSDSTAEVECEALVDKGGEDWEICGHKYLIRR